MGDDPDTAAWPDAPAHVPDARAWSRGGLLLPAGAPPASEPSSTGTAFSTTTARPNRRLRELSGLTQELRRIDALLRKPSPRQRLRSCTTTTPASRSRSSRPTPRSRTWTPCARTTGRCGGRESGSTSSRRQTIFRATRSWLRRACTSSTRRSRPSCAPTSRLAGSLSSGRGRGSRTGQMQSPSDHFPPGSTSWQDSRCRTSPASSTAARSRSSMSRAEPSGSSAAGSRSFR